MRFLMKKTSYQSAIVSAGEPRDGARLPIRYELPYDCNPNKNGHHLGVFSLSERGDFEDLISQKRLSASSAQGFDELEFQPADNRSYCLVYATNGDIVNSIIASFRFTTRSAN